MFKRGVKEAFTFYSEVFKNSHIVSLNDIGGGMGSGEIEIEGQRIRGFDGGDHFAFSDAFSLMIDCRDQAEVDYYWEKLAGNGGEEGQCGWVKDRFGLSWQIVPTVLNELLSDPVHGQDVMRVMMQMQKLDINKLQEAAGK
jgi:predicted 3-demethylubiquinone-9 3-methyltransferase (glyoxalase superfamily)